MPKELKSQARLSQSGVPRVTPVLGRNEEDDIDEEENLDESFIARSEMYREYEDADSFDLLDEDDE